MDNVLFKKLTLCAANPRSRKATISSFFKSLALRFSFSVCCRTCLFFRLLLRFGELVVLRVASVTLYEAGDADILGECSSSLRGSAHGAFFKRKKCQKLFRVFLLSFFCFCSRLLFSSSDVFVLSFTRGLRKKICAKKSNNLLNSSYIFC